jgi:hypothetical protein
MALSALLQGVGRLALDTAPLIYFFERHPQFFVQIEPVIAAIDSQALRGIASSLALLETLVGPLQNGNHTLADTYRRSLAISLELVPVDDQVADAGGFDSRSTSVQDARRDPLGHGSTGGSRRIPDQRCSAPSVHWRARAHRGGALTQADRPRRSIHRESVRGYSSAAKSSANPGSSGSPWRIDAPSMASTGRPGRYTHARFASMSTSQPRLAPHATNSSILA